MSRLKVLQFQSWCIEWWEKDACMAQAGELEPLLSQLFPDDDWAGFGSRIGWRPSLCAVAARNEAGHLDGFKLGYMKENGWLHSWLGGVSPSARGSGLASQLLKLQHAWAPEAGFTAITTSTRQPNTIMAILNLKAGFVVSGFEQAPGKPAIVHYFKPLTPTETH